jgi:hypothetical protein
MARTIAARVAALSAILLTLSLAGGAQAGGRPFETSLAGANEVGGGDPDGAGSASVWLNPGQGEVCFAIEVSGVSPIVAAHIHHAPAGVNGPVVVPFVPGQPLSGGCVSADRDLILAILRTPDQYYVNVHSTEYPGGALRGQLGK